MYAEHTFGVSLACAARVERAQLFVFSLCESTGKLQADFYVVIMVKKVRHTVRLDKGGAERLAFPRVVWRILPVETKERNRPSRRGGKDWNRELA